MLTDWLVRWARGRGPLRWWAVRRLVLAGDRGDPVATDAVWDLWFAAPDGELWAALDRWRRPRAGGGQSLVALGEPAAAADVVAAARRVGHPVAAAARAVILAGQQKLVDAVCAAALSTEDEALVRLCVEHHLAPADPRQAAMFFLLTGQGEQYRLADPDHSLLAIAYRAASEDERSRVRARVAGAPDLVRVLADTVRRDRMAGVSLAESEYLVDAFAKRQDWSGLWALAKDLPVVDAAAAVRRCADWRPEGHDAALFDILAAADLAELLESHAAVATPRTLRLPVKATNVGSIAPDGRRLALGTSHSVDRYTFPDSAPMEHLERTPTRHNCKVLALDGDVVVISDWDHQGPAVGFSETGYVPHGDRASGTYKFRRAAAFARTAAGFAALTFDENKDARRLHLLSGSGRNLANYERRVLDLWAELPTKFARGIRTMAIDPESGRIAFAGNGLHLAEITGDGLRRHVTAPFDAGLVPHLSFSGPDRLIGVDDAQVLRVWRVAEQGLHVVAERKFAGYSMVDLPAAGVVAAIIRPDNTRRWVRYLDGETLADAPTPERFDQPGNPSHLFTSPDGAWLGVGFFDFVELTEVGGAGFAARPLGATTPADLHAVRAHLDRSTDPRVRPYLELLHACLVHRFGVDVALGSTEPVGARGDDIVLGGSA